jgi:drug/metabolite transporter (DMT)-like permease
MTPEILMSRTALAALVLGAVLMGASPIFVRLADVGPFASAFWRVALALPVLWAWDRSERRPGKSVRTWTRPALLAGVLFAGDLTFWHLAILNTTVANATFFATTAPLWVLIGAFALKSDTVTHFMSFGVALAFLGGALLVGESLSVAPERVTGDLYGLVTAVFFGGYFLAVRSARQHQGAARVILVSSVVTAALLAVIAVVLEPRLLPATLEGMAALVALALLSHAGGQGLLAYALGHLPATFSSLIIFLEALAAAALGWIALGERLSPVQFAGGAVILAGIWIARPRARNDPHAGLPPT